MGGGINVGRQSANGKYVVQLPEHELRSSVSALLNIRCSQNMGSADRHEQTQRQTGRQAGRGRIEGESE